MSNRIYTEAMLMIDEQRQADKARAHARAQMAPKRNYTNFSGNYGGSGDEAWERYFKSLEKWKNKSAW